MPDLPHSHYILDAAQPAALDPHLLIGVAPIDREHGRLFDLLRRLMAMPGAAPNSYEFTEVLCQLGSELPAHFHSEEKILKSCGMPAAQVQEHLEAHKEILSQYAELNFELMTHLPQRTDVLRMIGAWIILHIELYDLSLKDYLPTPA